jgi:hypothetical protein
MSICLELNKSTSDPTQCLFTSNKIQKRISEYTVFSPKRISEDTVLSPIHISEYMIPNNASSNFLAAPNHVLKMLTRATVKLQIGSCHPWSFWMICKYSLLHLRSPLQVNQRMSSAFYKLQFMSYDNMHKRRLQNGS